MTLIDRDAVLKTIPSEEMVARMAVMSAPTVDAVPVSLIQSEIDFLTLAAEGEMEVTGQHGEVYAELAELKKLMSLWENEREKQNV